MNACFCGLCSPVAPSLCAEVQVELVTETKSSAASTIEATIPEEIVTRRFNKQAVVFTMPRVALALN
jgi:hypothetical protein